jgi:putative transposase
MANQRRKFSDEDKLNVLREAEQHGISNILRHYNISYSVFARWRQNFMNKEIIPNRENLEQRRLLEENIRLKRIIADQALSLEMKNEELKRLKELNGKRNV